jgi:hypothetical protein
MWPFKKKPPKKRIVRKQKYKKIIQKFYDVSFTLTNGTTYNAVYAQDFERWLGPDGFNYTALAADVPFYNWYRFESLVVLESGKCRVELNTKHIIRVDWKEASYTELTVPDGYEEVEE